MLECARCSTMTIPVPWLVTCALERRTQIGSPSDLWALDNLIDIPFRVLKSEESGIHRVTIKGDDTFNWLDQSVVRISIPSPARSHHKCHFAACV